MGGCARYVIPDTPVPSRSALVLMGREGFTCNPWFVLERYVAAIYKAHTSLKRRHRASLPLQETSIVWGGPGDELVGEACDRTGHPTRPEMHRPFRYGPLLGQGGEGDVVAIHSESLQGNEELIAWGCLSNVGVVREDVVVHDEEVQSPEGVFAHASLFI